MDLISRKAAIKFAKEQMVKGTGAYTKGWNAALFVMKSALNNHDAILSVPAVPLEPLAKWIAENLDPRCGCSYCSRDRVCCDCPTMTEQQVKEEFTKWMEEPDDN